MIVEVFFGSLVIFLPVGMASLIVGLIYKFQNNFELNIIENWAYALVLWGIISIIISYLIQRYFKNNEGGNKDINSYWFNYLKKSNIVFKLEMSFKEESPLLDFNSTSFVSIYCLPITILRGIPISSESFILVP